MKTQIKDTISLKCPYDATEPENVYFLLQSEPFVPYESLCTRVEGWNKLEGEIGGTLFWCGYFKLISLLDRWRITAI